MSSFPLYCLHEDSFSAFLSKLEHEGLSVAVRGTSVTIIDPKHNGNVTIERDLDQPRYFVMGYNSTRSSNRALAKMLDERIRAEGGREVPGSVLAIPKNRKITPH